MEDRNGRGGDDAGRTPLGRRCTSRSGKVGDVTVVPIQITGPASERLNLVILCDGYQADEMQSCRDDVDRNQNVQWSVEPFRSYRNYFNVYRVEIVSEDSGVRCDPDDNDNPNTTSRTRRSASGIRTVAPTHSRAASPTVQRPLAAPLVHPTGTPRATTS